MLANEYRDGPVIARRGRDASVWKVGDACVVHVRGMDRRATVERLNPKRVHVRLASGSLVEQRYGELRESML